MFIRLSEFINRIKDTLDAEYYGETFKVVAEITDVKIYYQKTYAFLKLIEKRGNDIVAEISASIWNNNFGIISKFQKETGQSLEQNLELLLEVEVQFHVRYGLRLSVIGIDAAYTLGKLEQQKTDTLQRLLQNNRGYVFLEEGVYFSANAGLKVAEVLQNIALICAPGSDGRRDFVHELEANPWHIDYNIVEFHTQVQGPGAASQIIKQLELIESYRQKSENLFHCICIVRGGGSNTDFAVFDDYELNLQIASAKLPVFTGIGHDRNISIADMMAAGFLKTPTKCAAFINEHNALYLSYIAELQGKIAVTVNERMAAERNEINRYKERLGLALNYYITKQKTDLNYLNDKIKMMNPGNVLQRGFALVRKNNKIITKKMALVKGDIIDIELKDGMINATVNE